MAISIMWTDRRGNKHTCEFFSIVSAVDRLKYLNDQEELTKTVAPSDSGDVRYSYNKEADSIRLALDNLQ